MSSLPGSPSPLPIDGLADYLASARWFGGKGREFTVASVRRVGEVPVPQAEPRVVIDLIEVRYTDAPTADDAAASAVVEEPPARTGAIELAVDGSAQADADDAGSHTPGAPTELYQLPLALYAHPQERLGHAFVSWHDEGGSDSDGGVERWMHAYDAVHDREAMAGWLAAFAAAEPGAEDLTFHRLPGHELDVEVTSTAFSGEQSNSSVMFGDDSLMKVFRKVTPGVNPDVEIHDVLTRAGSTHVAALYGWLEAPTGDEPLQLALLQQFLKTASDGWELALTSVRNLFAESAMAADGDLTPEAAGGDFADEAHRLGVALAQVHATLAEHFGTLERDGAAMGELAATMNRRLDEALAVVPQLAEHEAGLRETFDAVGRLAGVEIQRVHGDLHLGQTLRTVNGWKLVDFEGEPAKPLAERVLPDSPWRDVAGMLRSFDYAGHAVTMTAASADLSDGGSRSEGAAAWAARNRQAFLDGYTEGRAMTAADQALLAAYVADKAVYEAVYEARNRPSWLPIPLAALSG